MMFQRRHPVDMTPNELAALYLAADEARWLAEDHGLFQADRVVVRPERPSLSIVARVSASAGILSRTSSTTVSRTWTTALRAMSPRISVSSSRWGFGCSRAARIEEAGQAPRSGLPSWGSTGPSTASGSMRISSAARATSAPPDMA